MYKVMTIWSCMGTAQAISEVSLDYRFTALKISYLENLNCPGDGNGTDDARVVEDLACR